MGAKQGKFEEDTMEDFEVSFVTHGSGQLYSVLC